MGSDMQVCMAEDVCISKSCGKAYEHTATNFPITISYEKSRNGGSTTFDFKVRIKGKCMDILDALVHSKSMQDTDCVPCQISLQG
jgi:hypothetical protein